MADGTCSVDGCGRFGRVRRGWCDKHYQRWQHYGDPLRERPTLAERLAAGLVRHESGCLLWTGRATGVNGYGYIDNWRAHRLAWALAHPGEPLPEVVRHTCDTPLCCEPTHLLAGTQADNARDMVERNRSLKGERQPQAKLTNAEVTAIRAAWAAGGILQRELAEQYGVTQSNICKILKGKSRT